MKTLVTIVVIILVLGGAFLYLTRPAAAPSVDVNSAVSTSTDSTVLTSGTSYKISQVDSVVVFKIGEVLNDKPTTAIGTTSQVAAEILVSTSSISFSEIVVNARTFKTDSEKRDGAIARFILKSEDAANEFIRFRPSAPVVRTAGTPSSTETFTVNGDLTIAGVTKPATFTVVMNIADDKLTGTASLTMKRSDFNLTIPNVPSVASVEDQMTVTSNIVAPRVN